MMGLTNRLKKYSKYDYSFWLAKNIDSIVMLFTDIILKSISTIIEEHDRNFH